MTRGVDGGPGLSGLVVQTNTSLGLLFPSTFDAISCTEHNGENRELKTRREKPGNERLDNENKDSEQRKQVKGVNEGRNLIKRESNSSEK